MAINVVASGADDENKPDDTDGGQLADGPTNDASKAGRALGKLGASKGGKARAERLAPDERQAIAKNAIAVRWDKAKGLTAEELAAIPKATHKAGPARING